MDTKPYVSGSVSEMENEFRKVRKAFLSQLEAEADGFRRRSTIQFENEAEMRKAEEEGRNEELAGLKAFGLDEKKLKKLDDIDKRRGEEYVAKVEPKLIASLPEADDVHREHVARVEHFNRRGMIQPVCLGADLITTSDEVLAEFEGAGQRGNPGVWYNDPGDLRQIRLVQIGTWETSSCWPGALAWPKVALFTWWFLWVPPPGRPGAMVSNFVIAAVNMRGHYVLHALDKWYNCKEAFVRVRAKVDLFQDFPFFFWGNSKKVTVLDENLKRGSEAEIIQEHVQWDETVLLQPEKTVYFAIVVRLVVYAKGAGSHAVLDFLGPSKGLQPLLMVAF